ncbi:MAG: flagellar biosynthetic protein FliO [Planctomycetaceae bacterium]
MTPPENAAAIRSAVRDATPAIALRSNKFAWRHVSQAVALMLVAIVLASRASVCSGHQAAERHPSHMISARQDSSANSALRNASAETASLATASLATDGDNASPFIDLRQQPVQTKAAASSATPEINSDLFVGLGVWTVIVLCLCVLTVLGIRQWQRGRGMLPAGNSNSRVLETVSLGPNRMVSLVSLGDVRAIVGCDAAGIRSIVLAPPRFEEEIEAADQSIETT